MSQPKQRQTATRPRRELGSFYTPAPVVRFMLRSCLKGLIDRKRETSSTPMTILDPSCGDGAFLLEAAQAFSDVTRPAGPGEELPECAGRLYGVDLDPQAIDTLQRRLASRDDSPTIQVVCGDALTGPAFGELAGVGAPGVDWSRTFPEVADEGGFDLVIGNPPYLREKSAKTVFDRIAISPLGQRWRQPRMDLWHYFLHRGLDLLKPGGVLSFILNSYWTSAASARKLVERLREETTIERIVLLGEDPIFRGVSGRHMILQLRRGRQESQCQVLDLSESANVLRLLEETPDRDQAFGDVDRAVMCWRPQSMLFDSGRLVVASECDQELCVSGKDRLSDRFAVRQGIAENPPFVTRKMADESGGTLSAGMGVFVLNTDEVEALRLAPQERLLLRPYFKAASIRRFSLPSEPTHWLLYLTRDTAPEIVRLPSLARHLQPHQEMLKRRREVRTGAIAWWHLHWPRRESLFTEPRILTPQMGRQPAFVYAERPTFVGFAVNVVQSAADGQRPAFSLPALTAILNSQSASEWFARRAKYRGVRLDISGGVLRSVPLPSFDPTLDRELTILCLRRQSLCGEGNPSPDETELDAQIDRLIRTSYGLSGTGRDRE